MVQGSRSKIGRDKIERGGVKNSIGKVEAKELNRHDPWT